MFRQLMSLLGHCILFLFLSALLYALSAGAMFFSWLYQAPLSFDYGHTIWRILLLLVVVVLPAFMVGLRVYKGKVEKLKWTYAFVLVSFMALAEFGGMLFVAIAPMKIVASILESDTELPIRLEEFVSLESGLFLLGITLLIGIGFSPAIAWRKRRYAKRMAINF